MWRLIFLCALLLIPVHASAYSDKTSFDAAPRLVEVSSIYNGTTLTAYGYCPPPCHVSVELRGPERTFVLYDRKRVMGFWTNPVAARLPDMPSYLAYATSDNAATANPPYDLAQPVRDILDLRHLWPRNTLAVQQDLNGLFTARFAIPPSAAQGDYTLTATLTRYKKPPEIKVLTVQVVPTGLSSRIKNFAQANRIAYAGLCLLMAFGIGFAGYTLLRRE